MHVKIIQDSASRFLKENATTLLTAGGVVGTVTTGVLAFRAGLKSAEIIENERAETASRMATERARITSDMDLPAIDPATISIRNARMVKLVWPQFIPPVVVGGATIGAIIMANRLSAKEAAVLAAAYGVSQKQLEEYRTKLTEKLTPNKAQQAKDEIAQERVNENPVSNTIIVVGDEVLCFDKATGRYFTSSMEKIRRAANAANAEIIQHGWAGADHFYDELEMEPTTWTKNVGWNEPFELEISHALAKDERPCITVDFSRMPDPNYRMDYS